jgi:hypothetical protein
MPGGANEPLARFLDNQVLRGEVEVDGLRIISNDLGIIVTKGELAALHVVIAMHTRVPFACHNVDFLVLNKYRLNGWLNSGFPRRLAGTYGIEEILPRDFLTHLSR